MMLYGTFKGGSTANLNRHLKVKHPTVQPTQRETEQAEDSGTSISTSTAQPPPTSSATTSTPHTTVPHRRQAGQTTLTHFVARPIDPLRQKKVDEDLARMIALDLQPFSIVEDRGFKAFTKALNPSYILPSRQTLSKTIIPEMFSKVREQIMDKVGKASAVCLTTDCWTSRATCGFMSVTCHFIDNFKMETCLLDCFEFTERHCR